MASSSSSANSPTELSYSALLTALQACSERLKKNKRSLPKVIPQVTQELDTLLFAIRQHSMNNMCPSHRVYEAQVLMNKAVVKRHAGHHLEEAQCYLLADAIWAAVERERRGANFPTSGDALTRSVLCSAMACNVLLNNRYPAGQNPIPLRAMGTAARHIASDPATFQTNGLWCPHLARAWAVCYRLANILTDFNCIEMAADYFELAAIIVSVDVYGNDEAGGGGGSGSSSSSPNTSKSTHHLHAHRPVRTTTFPSSSGGNGASVTSGGASTASGVAPFGRGGGSSTVYSTGSKDHANNLYGKVRGGGGGAPSSSQSSSSHHNHNRNHGHADSNYSSPAHSPPTNGRPARGAKAAPTIGIAPGMLYHFIVALLCCARSCILIQDYPRALSIVDELGSYCGYVQKELAEHLEGRVWEVRRGGGKGGGEGETAARTTTGGTSGSGAVLGQSSVVSEAAVQRLSQVLSAAAGEDAAAASIAEATKIENNTGEEKVHDPHIQPAKHQDPAAAAPNNATQHAGEPTAATSPSYSPDPAHHLFTLLELSAAIVQARVMKFAIAIVLSEPDVLTVGHEQIAYVRHLSDLWHIHTDSTARVGLTKARNPNLEQLLSALKKQQQPHLDIEGEKSKLNDINSAAAVASSPSDANAATNASSSPPTPPTSDLATACLAHANETSRHLYRLATTMEMLLEESGWATKGGGGCSSSSPVYSPPTGGNAKVSAATSASAAPLSVRVGSRPPIAARELLGRRVLEASAGDLITLLSLLGIRSRDVTILIHRMHQSLVTNRLATLSSSSSSLSKIDLAKLQTAAALRSSIAAVPSGHTTSLVATAAAADTSAAPPSAAVSPSRELKPADA